ncbi:hypothetical protein E4K72_00455 [Oxalobacteraceae bacterium OM1]|nr:hypothetical protein E4K72_00455 [Oxalobacteraceae bacterium OM1]
MACVAAGMLTACAANISPANYQVSAVGRVNRTVAATVVSTRAVDVAGTAALGGTTGGALGAVIGSTMGGSDKANVASSLGGAILGGVAGATIEHSATKQGGMEYVIQTDKNDLLTIVQGAEPFFPTGSKVLLVYGSPARIIADARQ